MKKLLIATLCSLLLPQVAHAICAQNNNSLNGLVGLDQSNGGLYVSLNSNSNECSCTYARFQNVNTDTKSALSILLTAKATGNKVRIDFLDGTCNTAYRVYLH